MKKKIAKILAVALTLALLTSCAFFDKSLQKLTEAFSGVEATLSTYNANGQEMDRIVGKSFRISRDDRFDSEDSEGNSNKDSSVLLISLGDSHVSHVGSTLTLAEKGLVDVMDEANVTVNVSSQDTGSPWLNDMVEQYRNLFSGKSKVLMIRSQLGNPIAVYTGDKVEIFETDVMKSTWFRIDGKYLFVYRADYTLVDTDLLETFE